MDYHNLYLFVKIIQKGSYIAAADELNIPTSTLSRRVQQLEEQFGYQLLYRSARKLSLTEAGALFYRRCQPLYEELIEATEGLEGELTSPKGTLKVTAPISLANELLNPWFFEFMKQYPGINLDLLLVNRNIDVKEEGVDVAFRIGEIHIPDWIVRNLFTSKFTLCCSPGLIRELGHPQSLEDLHQYPLIQSRRSKRWQFYDHNGAEHLFVGEPRFIFDELRGAVEAAEAGIGVSNLPDYVIGDALTAGRLITLLPQLHPADREVKMVYPHRKYLPAKVRLFIEFIMKKVEQERDNLSV
ncbi:LysR family transcriptional regulator [Sessilibacter corallicola]|uniref:LysR family transcriptional regulator n=1 Tax=Sessilibacter corallicola TaxID=2904075 RepID=A0ABQ0ACV2_9GAMM